LINNTTVRDRYHIELRNRYQALQLETENKSTNASYNNFVKADKASAQNNIPLKRQRKRVPWDSPDIEIQRKKVKESELLNCRKLRHTEAELLTYPTKMSCVGYTMTK